jgi:uncharacterized Zn-binding protein involved in type VI secretion
MILGWLRVGDKAACGGAVAEGIPNNLSMGKPLTFLGAKIGCRGGCSIAEGHPAYTDNGRPIPFHLHKSTRGCPIYSTLNGIDGWENGSDMPVPVRAVKNEEGEWIEKFNEGYDQHFHLTDEETNAPLANRAYRMTCNGQVTEGKTDASGKTATIAADDPADVSVEVFPEGYEDRNK